MAPAAAPLNPTHETRLLPHHVGAVLQLAGRQRPVRRGRTVAAKRWRPGMATSGFGPHVCAVLRDPGTVCGRLCRRLAQGPGHALQQRHQNCRLPVDAVWHPPLDGVCHCRPGCCGLFTRQIRHPDRTVTGIPTGQGERVD